MKCFRKNKILKLLFLTILPCFSCFCFWDDIMEEVFKPVQDNIIYIWDSVSSVWKTILQEKESEIKVVQDKVSDANDEAESLQTELDENKELMKKLMDVQYQCQLKLNY